jgi:hypothetical protein
VRHLPLALFCALFVVKEFWLTDGPVLEAQRIHGLKSSFRDCYLGTENLGLCSANWPIHPDAKASRVKEKLNFLREHRLSLFREQSP